MVLDDKAIESVLKMIIEIDNKTTEEISVTNSKIEQREKDLQTILRKRKEEIEETRQSEGKRIYDEIIAKAEEDKKAILSKCYEHTNELDSLLEENKKKLRDKVFEKLLFD